MHEGDPQARVLTPTRRGFLKTGLALAAVVAFDGWRGLDRLAPSEETAGPGPGEPQKLEDTHGLNPAQGAISDLDDHLKDNPSLTTTLTDSLFATGAVTVYTVLANNKHVGLYSGNSGTEQIREDYKKKKLKTIGIVGVGAPVLEELAFRSVPALFGKKDSMMPVRGILSTYLFGKMHQFTVRPVVESIDPNTKKVSLDKNKVPVQQYALGGLYWMIARRRGVTHSIVAHAVNNGVALGFLEASTRMGGNPKPAEAAGRSGN